MTAVLTKIEPNPLPNDILANLPSLEQKFLVDLVNGIDVTNDHIKLQKNRAGIMQRISDNLSGASHRRQIQINEQLTSGLNNCISWINDLSGQITLTQTALTQVNTELNNVKDALAQTIIHSTDTREMLENFQQKFTKKLNDLTNKINAIDLREAAYEQMDALFLSWEAGNFSGISSAQRCFLVGHELAWGVFGDYWSIADDGEKCKLIKKLRDYLIIHVNLDTQLQPDQRVDAYIYLAQPDSNKKSVRDFQQALQYLGDNLDPMHYSFNWFVLNTHQPQPNKVPFIMDSRRLVDGMCHEWQQGGKFYVG